MNALKRKEGPKGASASNSSKSAADPRPAKRSKLDSGGKDRKPRAKDEKPAGSKRASVPVTSKLKEEEPLFPRGGGSVLSPLEHKQIQLQAKKDALFEQESGALAKNGSRAKTKRRSSSNLDSVKERSTGGDDAVKIESLNYQRLKRSSLVLGQVCMINALELVLSLPNNLVGRVPITAISSALTQRLHESAADAADADGNLDQEPENDVDLESLFEVGQYLRAYVVSTTDYKALAAGKMRHHIELSLQPEQANTGLSEQGIVENVTIMASVASVEDHGFVMDVGIAGSDMRGFLSRKQVDSSIAPQRLQPGSVLLCSIISKKSKIVQLSTLRERLGSVKYFPSEATTIDSFLPGTTADVLISDVTPRGVVGKVMGHLDVTADLVHSGAGPDGVDLESSYKIGSRLRARVICNFLEAAKPKLGISVLPHVVALKSKVAVQDGTEVGPLTLLPSSSLVETCTVRKVEAYIGLYVDVGVQNVPGFVHISRVKDGKVDALFENSGPYKVGSTHPGRVIGYSFFDGLFLLSLEKRVLEQPFIRIQDVPVGEVVSGLVERLVINKDGLGGVTVQLADGISGLVPEMHLADVPLRHPERKFRPGMKVKARVLSTNPSKHQIRLTLKKSLVNSEEPALKTFEEAAVGMQAHGAIIKILQHGAIVQFYGELRGFLPVSKMSEAYISDPKEHFRIGQVVSVHVLSVDPDARRLIVSCKDPRAPSLEQQLAMKSPQLGDLVSATVTQKTDDDTHDVEMANTATGLSVGLDAGGFDWSGGAVLDADDDTEMRDLALSQQTRKGKQRREGQIQVDKTAELDVHGPQTSSDYERLLLGQPDSSQLWIEYMAFQMKVSDLSKAREVAERAIRTINIREETEKLNVWVAYLNLEVAYGTEDSVSEVFQRACTHNDSQEVYERLASIYIIAKKYKEAGDLYESMLKKFGSKSLKVWTNYAHFLHATADEPHRARALLRRATQVLGSDAHTYIPLITKFAALEFHSPNGDREQGRTLFTTLLAAYPKKFDLWNQWLDLETSAYAAEKATGGDEGHTATIRDSFERGSKVKGLKARQAKAWFRRWAKWEEDNGDAKSRERVSAKAQEWARRAQERKQKTEAETGGDAKEEDS